MRKNVSLDELLGAPETHRWVKHTCFNPNHYLFLSLTKLRRHSCWLRVYHSQQVLLRRVTMTTNVTWLLLSLSCTSKWTHLRTSMRFLLWRPLVVTSSYPCEIAFTRFVNSFLFSSHFVLTSAVSWWSFYFRLLSLGYVFIWAGLFVSQVNQSS